MPGENYWTWAVIGATDFSYTPYLSCLKLSWKEGYEKVDTFLTGLFLLRGTSPAYLPVSYSDNRAWAYPALCYLFVCVRVGQIFVARFTAHFWHIFGMNTSHHAQWCGHAPTCVLFSSPGPSLRLKGRLEILLCDTIKWRSLTLFSADGKHLFSCNLKPLFKWHGVF